ncbi:hypothetical protein BDR07DRAFT_1409597 [Suillus spraguei]|nr:hypothetical protein BDR07DRAFT_1409597 [Suillus spraguei]
MVRRRHLHKSAYSFRRPTSRSDLGIVVLFMLYHIMGELESPGSYWRCNSSDCMHIQNKQYHLAGQQTKEMTVYLRLP